MKLNEKQIEEYGAVFLSFCAVAPSITSNIIVNGVHQLNNGYDVATQTRSLILFFEEEYKISDFISILLNGVFIDMQDGRFYDCLLIDTPAVDHIGARNYQVTCVLSAICHGEQFTKSEPSFIVEGNYRCACRYEITASEIIENFQIDGYLVKTLDANRKFIIDGVDKLIFYEESPLVSEFENIELNTFPFLLPGEYRQQKSHDAVSVVVKYSPIYL